MAGLEATLKCYLNQWDEFFGKGSPEELLSRLRTFAFEGDLRSCKFRSICWRIFLGCLPPDISQWKEATHASRKRYLDIKNKHVTEPSHEMHAKDLDVENPLSQNDQSMWKKYFKNDELKKTIERDVKRTFPEMEYFHDKKVHQLLVDVLFCYAQEHKDLSYRQGMHELLAPLVFIIHCDLQAACHAREIGNLSDLIDVVLDSSYLEHDSYHMFCCLMESTNAWYSVTCGRVSEKKENEEEEEEEEEEQSKDSNQNKSENGSQMPQKPFQPQEISTGSGPTLAITNKLNHIHNTLLVQHDLQLHTHLNRLEIIPQVFGLRWIRLLFGREFSLQDLLVLWDAMFADSHTLDLVDYLFVAMLIHIRYHLLNADYSTCMQILMKYPAVDDINDIVRAAKDIRQLKGRSFSDCIMEASNDPSSPTDAPPRMKKIPAVREQRSNSKSNTITRLFKDITRKVIPNNSPTSPPHSKLNDPTYAGNMTSPAQSRQSPNGVWMTNGSASARPKMLFTEAPKPTEMLRKNPYQLEEQVAAMSYELDKMRQMCTFCSEKIAASVSILQSNVSLSSAGSALCREDIRHDVEEATENDEQKACEREQIMLAVASLKQIRDLLQGSLSFNPNLREYNNKLSRLRPPNEKQPLQTDTELPKTAPDVGNQTAVDHDAGDIRRT